MLTKEKQMSFNDLKVNFNDIAMRELGLDIDDNDHIYDIDSESVYQIKEKFIKYSDEEYCILNRNEIELNLIENPRLMEILFGMWIQKISQIKNLDVTSFFQSSIRGSNKGYFVVAYIDNNVKQEIKSDAFINESVRILNLITKINHRQNMYDLSKFDIEIKKRNDK